MMQQDDVRKQLQRLYTELKSTRTTDQSTQQKLQALTSEVKKALDDLDNREPDQPRTVLGNLRASVQHFEATHPELTSVLNDVISSLANWGI